MRPYHPIHNKLSKVLVFAAINAFLSVSHSRLLKYSKQVDCPSWDVVCLAYHQHDTPVSPSTTTTTTTTTKTEQCTGVPNTCLSIWDNLHQVLYNSDFNPLDDQLSMIMYAERHIEQVKTACEASPPCALTNNRTRCELKSAAENDDSNDNDSELCNNANEEECSDWQCNHPSTSTLCGGRPSICNAMDAQIQWFTPSSIDSEYFGIPWIISTVLNDPMASRKSWLVDLCQKDTSSRGGLSDQSTSSVTTSTTTNNSSSIFTPTTTLPCFHSCIYTGSGYTPRKDVCDTLLGPDECSAAGCMWLSEDALRGLQRNTGAGSGLGSSPSSQTVGYIVGGVVAGCCCIAACVGWVVWRRRKQQRQEQHSQERRNKKSPPSFSAFSMVTRNNKNSNKGPSQVSSPPQDGVAIAAIATSTSATINGKRYSPSSKDSALVVPLTEEDSTASLNAQSSSKSLHADVRPWEISHSDLDLSNSKVIGSGSFGKVIVARYQETLVAVKYLLMPPTSSSLSFLSLLPSPRGPRDNDDGDGKIHNKLNIINMGEELSMVATLSSPKAAALREECQILASLRHPNVVQFMAYSTQPPAIITEYCSRGSLYDRLKEARQGGAEVAKQQLPWQRRLNMLLDAAKGMLYLHTRNVPIVHKDLKSPNLLVESSWRVKVTDFNLSKFIESPEEQQAAAAGEKKSEDSSNNNDSHSGPHNPRWLAPEIVSGASGFTFASDVYAFGIVMFEMLTFQVPWASEIVGTKLSATSTSTKSLKDKILNNTSENNNNKNSQCCWQIISWLLDGQRPHIPDELPGGSFDGIDKYIGLMERCWAQDAESRPSFAELVPELRSIAMSLMAAQKKIGP